MKKFLTCLLCGFLSVASCSRVEETVVSKLLNNYVNAQKALAADDLASATVAFTAIANATETEMAKIGIEISQTRNLESARSKCKVRSEHIVEMELPDGYVVAHCPMADDGNGADWVQQEGDIANPYFGTAMKGCGSIKETF